MMNQQSFAAVVQRSICLPIASLCLFLGELAIWKGLRMNNLPFKYQQAEMEDLFSDFMVDARGGAMRGCRHSGVRVIIPLRKAPMPMRITCRYLRKEKLAYPPPLMEGEACASRILEVGPSGAKFLGPVIIEVPHFASLRGKEREITILRSDNGETWREHTLEASEDAVHDVFNESFEGEELTALEDLSTNRITRILTTDFPQYFAIITRIRQEVHAIGPDGGMVSSTVVPQVQAIFPEGALTKKIKVGLQAQPITPELVTKLLGNRVAVSPIVTVEPRRRKFHKPITLTIPVPQAATKGMINQYSGDAPTLRLLCSITGSTKTGGTTKAQWEDVTGSTPLTFVNDCVSFTTTVSARFWLMDCRQVTEATKFATELYREAIHVPFMAKFVVFAKRHDPMEAQLRVFCMTDDKEDKTLESQEHFTEVAKSRDVEVLEGKPQYLEFAGNLVPVTKSGEQLSLTFQAFRENRLPFTIRVKDPHQEPMGRVAFMREPRVSRGEPPQSPICNLNIALPEADLTPVSELVTLEKKYGFVQETGLAKPELIHRADLRLSDIAKELGNDWVPLALQLDLPESDINSIRSENPDDTNQQALMMLRHWLQKAGSKATGNSLEKGLRKINREDIVNQCMFNVELVTDDVEKAVAKVHLDQSGFDTFKEELGSSRDASLRRETSLNGAYDEQDIMKDAESAAETSSESSDKDAHFRPDGKPVSEAVRREMREGAIQAEIKRTTTKVSEDGVETLVQKIPTTQSEAFRQHVSNGQMSDASVHEEDKSEPTVATLSSEATAEMEVSSLEDKSQAETHVERKEWTETDESGGIRQVTHIKTETSIKLDGDEKIAAREAQHVAEVCDSISSEEISGQYATRKFSAELCKKEEFKEAVKLDEDDSSSEDILKATRRPTKLQDISAVESNIKSEILREEIDQSIEDSPLEVKHIAEDLENISVSEDHKCNVYKHIRTEIFSQELGEVIESGSPERKELSPLRKSDEEISEEMSKELDEEGKEEISKATQQFEKEIDVLVKPDIERIKSLSPQVSEESIDHTEEISSSEGMGVEQDEHLVEYEEAKDEHSLTEQLLALASDSMTSPKSIRDSEMHTPIDLDSFGRASSDVSSGIADFDTHRRIKDIYTRPDKKDIRSLKSTKQVSTIEEHSSIESCESPQDLLRDVPEKGDSKEGYESDKDAKQPETSCTEFHRHDESDTFSTSEITETKMSKTEVSQDSSHMVPPSFDITKPLGQKSESESETESKSVPYGELDSRAGMKYSRFDDDSKKDSSLPRSDSKSSHGKKSDSDAEGSKVESIAESVGQKKEESFSSSGETESPYYSVETSDSGRTPRSTPAASRPCSSEFEINVFSGHGSEYETCVTSQEASGEASGSYATAISSQEVSYATACSSLSHSSRESAYSVDSESSGHLASVEVSSEASETLVPSAQEMELEFAPDIEMPVLDEEPSKEDSGVREPYEMDIPEVVIRSGIEMPFMKGWDIKGTEPDDQMQQLPHQWTWQYATQSEILQPFEVAEESSCIFKDEADSHPVHVTSTVESREHHVITDVRTTCGPLITETRHTSEGTRHRRSSSSAIDIVPMEQSGIIFDDEQLSESSATHSEQTWQTTSIDTALQLSSQAPPPCLAADAPSVVSIPDSLQETPPEREMSEHSPSIVQEESSYLQLNGPVEVDYNPAYDNPDGYDSELRTNQEQPTLYEADSLQFEMEIEGNLLPSLDTESDAVHQNGIDGAVDGSQLNGETVDNFTHSVIDFEPQGASTLDAEKPEAQQAQSFAVPDYKELQSSESAVCQDQTSYLPESDQCDLLSCTVESLPPSFESEINIPCGESVSSNEDAPSRMQLLPDLTADIHDRTDVVDTSPEDERYEYKAKASRDKSRKEESDILAESDYERQTFVSKYDEVPGTDLYTHHEEEEFDLRESDVYPSPIPSIEEDKQSTPSFDALHGRRFFPRSADTSAASSLQEFERLEAEIAAGRLSRSSIDSGDKVACTKSGEHDDVSMCSLTEFEKLEKECLSTESADKNVTEEVMLSEIEEGLESQCSDVLEILSESTQEHISEASIYEQRRNEIEEIIKVAQSNVEKFQEETFSSEGITSDDCTVIQRVLSDQDTSETARDFSREEVNTDVEESEPFLLTSEALDSGSNGDKKDSKVDCMASSTDSIEPSSSTATHATYQFETDSVVSSSINSAQASGEECTMVSSTDTLEPEPKLTYSQGDSTGEEKTRVSSNVHDEPLQSTQGALAYKLEELQVANGAKEQMEMFLSKLTDESSLLEDFTSYSVTDSQQIAPECIEEPHGMSSAGEGAAVDGDDVISRTTSTTTTRVVTTVRTGEDGVDGQEATEDGDDLRHSVEVILNQFMTDDGKPADPKHDE